MKRIILFWAVSLSSCRGESFIGNRFVVDRKLQLGTGILERFQVGESTIDFDGTQIEIVYPLSDLVPDNTVLIQTFSDAECTIDISDNDYLVPSITYDANPNPTGEKNREVTVIYSIDANEIMNHDVWVENEETAEAFISFCVAIHLYSGEVDDPNSSSQTRLDTGIDLKVDFQDGFEVGSSVGASDRLDENARQVYYVEGFICDESNEMMVSNEPFVQGKPVRVCVKPRDEALADGVKMRQVDSFTFYRDKDDGTQITQTALRDGKSDNAELTSVTCERGSELCWFETLLEAEFFYAPGITYGYGEAWLQFGSGSSRRRLQNGSRQLQVEGGLATTAAFDLEFFVIPGDFEYLAEAYHCDGYNNRQEDVPSISMGESVRICISPTEEARKIGIRIKIIDSFLFTRGRSKQNAVERSIGPEESQTVVMCDPGSEVCVFRTVLGDNFFGSAGCADGDGLVSLQYSVNSQTSVGRRRLQNEEEFFMAGQSPVKVETLLSFRPIGPDPCAFDHKFTEWWLEEENGKKALYIGIICGTAISALLCLLCCWLCPPFLFRRRDDKVATDENEILVNVDVKKDSENTVQKNTIVENQQRVPLLASEAFQLPGEFDVVFGDDERPGTKTFLGHVKFVAKNNPDKNYSPFIYREIKKPFVNCSFYKKDIEGQFSKPSGEELVGLIGDSYADALTATRKDTRTNVRLRSSRNVTRAQTTETGSSAEGSCTFESRSSSDRSLYTVGSSSNPSTLGSNAPACLPNGGDVIFEDNEHQGTHRFLERVLRVAEEFPHEEYCPQLYREIKAPFERKKFYVMTREGTHRRATKSECVGLIGKSFAEAKMTLRSLHSLPACYPTHVDSRCADDVSTLGEGTAMLSATASKGHKRRESRGNSVRSLKNVDGEKLTQRGSNRSIRSSADSHDRSVRTKRKDSSDGSEKITSRKAERLRAEPLIYKGIPYDGGNDVRSHACKSSSMRSVKSTETLSEMDSRVMGGRPKRHGSASGYDDDNDRSRGKSIRSVKSASNLSELEGGQSPKMPKRRSSRRISSGDDSARQSKRGSKDLRYVHSDTNLREMERRASSKSPRRIRSGNGSVSQSVHTGIPLNSKKGISEGSKKLKRSRSTGQIVERGQTEAPSSSATRIARTSSNTNEQMNRELDSISVLMRQAQ